MVDRPSQFTRSIRAVLLTVVLGLAAATAFDRWYAGLLVERERTRVQAFVAPYTSLLEGIFQRRVVRLEALRSFVSLQPSADELARKFPTFADGLRVAAPEVRAVQLVQHSRIVATNPEADAAALIGYDLSRHPDPEVRDGVERASRTDSMAMAGPFQLLQGGNGIVLRMRVTAKAESFPDQVALVLNVGELLMEADFGRLPSSLQIALLDRQGRPVAPFEHVPTEPLRFPVSVGDGQWMLLVAPALGWSSAVFDDLRPTRLASALIIVLLTALAYGVAGRQERLRQAVADRTGALAQANDDLRREAAERRDLEEQLLHSQKMEAVGTLAGGVAHDFNNLLTAIVGFAQLAEQQAADMQRRADGSDDARQLRELRTDLSEIMKASDRASLLTAQLLSFSRRQKSTPARLDVNVSVRDIDRMLRRLIGETVMFSTDVSQGQLPVHADGGQLAQVIVNLVVNARDALSNGGRIQVRTRTLDLSAVGVAPFAGLPAGEWAIIEVEDDGVGMSPEVVARMFEPFFTTKRLGDGTGLGLSTVYGIVTQAGGQLFVESAPGRGTTVSVALPRLDTCPLQSPSAPQPPSVANGELVLVVEDEAGLRRLVGEILKRQGYRVEVAYDGQDALDQLEQAIEAPDLVLTDVVMPRLGGRELAEAIVARRLDIPVLFMSGYQEGDPLPDDTQHGYIAKPFTPDALINRVRAMVRTRV
ncbi:MAG: response regulator [Gemmatimonadaceae bacterium]|nr:response regulator [Gemmatimonadaceae bacterium]